MYSITARCRMSKSERARSAPILVESCGRRGRDVMIGSSPCKLKAGLMFLMAAKLSGLIVRGLRVPKLAPPSDVARLAINGENRKSCGCREEASSIDFAH